MIYYHISTDLSGRTSLKPTLPNRCINQHDKETPRIAVSRTLEGALSIKPLGAEKLGTTLRENGDVLKVYRIDSSKIIFDAITPAWLRHTGIRPDALEKEEYWITTDITVPKEDVFFIRIDAFDLEKNYIHTAQMVRELEAEKMSTYEFKRQLKFRPNIHEYLSIQVKNLLYKELLTVDKMFV